MNDKSNFSEILEKVRGSAGARYFDLMHQRSFSFNIFQINSIELMEAIQRVKDTDQGLALMMQENREAGLQAHRELNRHIHNFVSSALTLVEHTRVFMRAHYASTGIIAAYEKKVREVFLHSSVAQFVQGLRNYMLHCGLPNSSMFMKFVANPESKDGSGTMETGVQYDTASLLKWDGWKAEARLYIEQAGSHLNLHQFSQEYFVLINKFYEWLEAEFMAYHHHDIQEFEQLQEQLHAIDQSERTTPIAPNETSGFPIIEPFEFTDQKAAEMNKVASDLLGKIQEVHLRQEPQGFPTERPMITITEPELIGPITGWAQDSDGKSSFIFIQREGKTYGLSESDYETLDGLIDVSMSSDWVSASLSREFVEKVFVDWSRKRFELDEQDFSKVLSATAREEVATIEVLAPIANMEVEEGFSFGPVRIEPITADAFDKIQAKAPLPRPEQEQQVSQLFDGLRREIQGYAAVVIAMEAEPVAAQERALRVSQDVVGLLRFFSPAASLSYLFSSVALIGAAYVPQSKLIVLYESGLSINQSLLTKHVGQWRLSSSKLTELKSSLLEAASLLVEPTGLSEFCLAVRASILTYSKGMTLADPLDRLRNCLSALEGIFLKHEMEPREHSIANRMSFLLDHGEADRESVRNTVQKVYWLQGQPRLMTQSRREEELIMMFTSYAYNVLCVALGNILNFDSKMQFVIEVDRLGSSSR